MPKTEIVICGESWKVITINSELVSEKAVQDDNTIHKEHNNTHTNDAFVDQRNNIEIIENEVDESNLDEQVMPEQLIEGVATKR